MTCKICAISNEKLKEKIENLLYTNSGHFSQENKNELSKEFSAFADEINAIDDQSVYLHYHFHMQIARVSKVNLEASSIDESKNSKSRLVDEVKYDEAEVLYEVLNMQAATFNALSNKINKALTDDAEEQDLKMLFIHPETRQFYSEIAGSIRATVKEIRETHKAINGEKDSALDGLKAIAAAIHGVATSDDSTDDMTTKQFDD